MIIFLIVILIATLITITDTWGIVLGSILSVSSVLILLTASAKGLSALAELFPNTMIILFSLLCWSFLIFLIVSVYRSSKGDRLFKYIAIIGLGLIPALISCAVIGAYFNGEFSDLAASNSTTEIEQSKIAQHSEQDQQILKTLLKNPELLGKPHFLK